MRLAEGSGFAVPAVIYTLLVLTVPQSPRWLLIVKNDRPAAAKTLQLIDPGIDVEAKMEQIVADHRVSIVLEGAVPETFLGVRELGQDLPVDGEEVEVGARIVIGRSNWPPNM